MPTAVERSCPTSRELDLCKHPHGAELDSFQLLYELAMMKEILRMITPIVTVLFIGATGSAQKSTEVVVLSTLHQLHAEVKGYSFQELGRTIEKIRPDVLAVELTPGDLESRREQKTKVEYAQSVFPLIDKNKYRVVALEPAEPLFSELVGLARRSDSENREKHPERVEAFSIYSKALYGYLLKHWDSVAAVNSKETDALFAVKHDYQNELFGASEAKVWNDWNTHFLYRIRQTAAEYRGKRILVLVGAEHAYWLRDRLSNQPSIKLRSVSDLL